MSGPHELQLELHGLRVSVHSDDADVAGRIRSDFSLFECPTDGAPPVLRVHLHRGAPPRLQLPRTLRRLRTKDARVYEHAGRRYLDSGGRALVILDFRAGRADIHAEDSHLLQEKAYLLILSRIGEALDLGGLHRVHAMGVVREGRAAVCAMASGGGKTTLCLGLLERPGFALLSDEAPLIDRQGRLHPLPLRLGVVPDSVPAIPDAYLTRFDRSRYEPKVLIDASYFSERIAGTAEPGLLLIGRRNGDRAPQAVPISRAAAGRALWRDCVRARGVPQLLEYVLRPIPGALLNQAWIHASRLWASANLVRRSRCFELRLGPEPGANAELVEELLEGLDAPGHAGPGSLP